MLTHGKRLPRATGFAALTLLVSLSARSDAAERVVVAATPEGGKPIVAKTDAVGTIHLALDSADGPRYAQSSDGGKTFSKLLPLVDAASRRPGLEFTVWDLVIDPSGCVHVALGTNAWKLKLPKEEWGCFYVRLEADATAFTAVKEH